MGYYLWRIIRLLQQVLVRLTEMTGQLDELLAGQRRQDLVLVRILANTTPPAETLTIVFTVTINGRILEGVTSVDIKVTQRFSPSVSFFDALGNPATVDGVPEWSC